MSKQCNEELTIHGGRKGYGTSVSTISDVFRIRHISATVYIIEKDVDGVWIPIKQTNSRMQAQNYVDYELGYRERLREIVQGTHGLFRDEKGEKDLSIYRKAGRDDAERYILSNKRDRDVTSDIGELMLDVFRRVNKTNRLLTDNQIRAVMKQAEKEKAKRHKEHIQIIEELSKKTDVEDNSLKGLCSKIANRLLLEER